MSAPRSAAADTLGAGDRRPRGRRPKSAAQVESQRWRLIEAAAEVLAERGYARVTSRAVARRADFSAETFYKHFDHLDACLLAACEVAADCLWDLVAAACTGAGEWPQRLRGAVEAALAYVASEPALACLLAPEAAAGIAAVATIRQRLIERLAGLLCSGRQLRIETADALPDRLELHLVSGAFAFVSERFSVEHPDRIAEVASPLTEILASSFRDPAACRLPT
jgi:AcrR family transcriptional regulator